MIKLRDSAKPLHHMRTAAACAAALLLLATFPASAQTVSDTPLSVGGNVPGNLLLTPSVEFPTVDSVANLGETYNAANLYTGYFDSLKCYQYAYDDDESLRHFYPINVGTSTSRSCAGAWSGNYLNWAATQTIDPFRKALTGGYRVHDTATETWLEKARSDNNSGGSYFRNRNITGTATITGMTPAGTRWSNFRTRISRAGNKMLFARADALNDPGAALPTVTAYNPAIHTLNSNTDNTVYEVSMRVKVCDAAIGVEANCVQYSQGWKPEGLIQKYSNRIRYSAFGYLNDSDILRDGGALRAKQKFVGPLKKDPADIAWTTNPNREWDPNTGVFVQNPDPADATATNAVVAAGGGATRQTTVENSGVINYINKFGQMTTANHKSFDPVSELYYAAIRYLKNQGNVPAYTNLSGSASTRYSLADGFPVITDWNDPIQYSCQNNAILGIGDANTHRDKNLPGHTGSMSNEPTRPAQVTADTTVNVRTAILKLAEREGITINLNDFSGRENSAYIAALAYDSHTRDIRSDLDGRQSVSTYWVDVRENSILEPRARNQYWLAAKYGGFEVPDGFDPYAGSDALPNASWNSGETLESGDPRPENFYVASEAGRMVESLTRAFARIAAESVGSASSLASNSTRLDTDTRTFQAQFYSGSWRGELNAFSVAADGSLSTAPIWRASNMLASTTWSSRDIRVNAGGTLQAFNWSNLTAGQRTALGSQDIVNYLRGERAHEESQTNGTLRTRTGVLGDIVSSTPVYVGTPNARLYATATFTGASAYAAFATANASRTPVVYVGANDGMLHAFNANTGAEVFAFVPAAAIANNLADYADPDYVHRYFVDGEVAVADIYDAGGGGWRTVLVGTMGRGGQGAFALDVTDPHAPALLWERDASDIPQLGKNIGRPVIAQVANGVWRVLIGNGPNSSGGRSQLIQIGLGGASNGVVTVTATSDTSTTNGLTAVLARDSNADGFADTAYAGDLQGNLWKFSSLGGSVSVMKLFEARDASNNRQPIMAAPLVGRHPTTGQVWVFFGTGQYLNEADLNSHQVQTWYGLKDTNTTISGRAALVSRAIQQEGVVASTPVRVIEEGTENQLDSSSGWYIDLISPVNGAEGERMVVPNRFQGVALIGTTRIPEEGDPCKPGGTGWIMAINPFTGTRLTTTFFDVNGDGQFNSSDMICDSSGCLPVSGIGFASSPNNPIFVENIMQVGLDDGTTRTIRTQGSAVQATRMSWRELLQTQ
ncbi:MAG: PilC/PilY family type IV pilus protein [Steroidobacteraceae bacterium]